MIVNIPPSKLKVKVVVFDLDENGHLQIDETGEIKTKVIDKCVVSVDIEMVKPKKRRIAGEMTSRELVVKKEG